MPFVVKGATFCVHERFQLLGACGSGSYGVVAACHDKMTGKKVAIKKVTPMAGDDWDATHTLREIRIMRHVQHPNIMQLVDLQANPSRDELYITMELMQFDLHKLLQSKTVLRPHHVQLLMLQLLRGTAVLHRNRIIHRDLKPANLLVNAQCQLRITDFGLSRQAPAARIPSTRSSSVPYAGHPAEPCDERVDSSCSVVVEQDNLAVAGEMTEYVVTRWYRPPELMLAPGRYCSGVDMWSIGCIFAEILERKPLFAGKDYKDQLSRIFRVITPPPSAQGPGPHQYPAAWGYEVNAEALRFVASLPRAAAPWRAEARYPDLDPKGCQLLTSLLCFNPSRRITARRALSSPYLDAVREQLPQPASDTASTAELQFDFEGAQLPVQRLRKLIELEVMGFRRDQRRATAQCNNPSSTTAATVSTNAVAANNEPEHVKEKAAARQQRLESDKGADRAQYEAVKAMGANGGGASTANGGRGGGSSGVDGGGGGGGGGSGTGAVSGGATLDDIDRGAVTPGIVPPALAVGDACTTCPPMPPSMTASSDGGCECDGVGAAPHAHACTEEPKCKGNNRGKVAVDTKRVAVNEKLKLAAAMQAKAEQAELRAAAVEAEVRAQRTERDRLARRYQQYKCDCTTNPPKTAAARSITGISAPKSTSASASATLLQRKENIAPKAVSIVPHMRQARSYNQLQTQASAQARSHAQKRVQLQPRTYVTSRANSHAARSRVEPESQRQLQPRQSANTYSSRLLVPTASSRRKHAASTALLAKAPTLAHRDQHVRRGNEHVQQSIAQRSLCAVGGVESALPRSSTRTHASRTSTSTSTRGGSALKSVAARTQRYSTRGVHPRVGRVGCLASRASK